VARWLHARGVLSLAVAVAATWIANPVLAIMASMLETLRDLVAHKGYANAAILRAIAGSDPARADQGLNALLHHVLLANRFWMLAVLGESFVAEEESRLSRSFDALVQRFSTLQDQESRWVATATETDLGRELRDPLIPGGTCSVAEALLQVCMHSHGHRAQIATRLRDHGVAPPPTEFINWLTSRPTPTWPTGA
jgi:uncharacterized damage-inducible protein DinB